MWGDLTIADMVLWLSIMIFSGVLLAVAKYYPQDGQTFQIISGLLTGFAGAFFARLKPKPDASKDKPPNTKEVTHTVTEGTTVSDGT